MLLLFLLLSGVSGFNLDPRIPIIKTGGNPLLEERYFGFAVAQHVNSSGEGLLLVGAPRDDNLQPGTTGSGALWSCRLTMRLKDCVQVPTDGKRYSNISNKRTYGLYDGSIQSLQSPINSEIKDGQWLGGIVESQGPGGNVIVCAHRYTVRDVHPTKKTIIDSKRGMLGMCYILDPDLTLPRNTMIGYKNVVIVRQSVGGRRLEPKGNFDDHASWGVCQLGTSARFVQDSDLASVSPNVSMALFGSPGCFTWRGNVFGAQVESQKRYDVAFKHDHLSDYEKHGHLGLSVASGRFDGVNLHFVSGAPAAGKTGSVYFFLKSSPSNFQPDPELTIHGEVFGEGFGHVLVTLDVNGDSQADLLVGAPFFEEGSVYLYPSQRVSKRSKRTTVGQTKIKIVGEAPLSQFGLAISSLGDLNRDGFEDFAVGAPYESDVGGAVYIFFGGVLGLRSRTENQKDKSSPVLTLKAAQVAGQIVSGKEMSAFLPFPVQTFGGSLSGGMDLDRNGYPDLLVGAYASNTVFLLRARPIIDIQTSVEGESLKGVDPGASGCPEDPDSDESCFSFKTCFQVLHNVDRSFIQSNGTLSLKFVIEAEPEKPFPRISLRLADRDVYDNRSRLITDSIVIHGETRHCSDIIGYVGSLHADIQSPVPFSMSYSIIQSEPAYDPGGPLPDINNYPILNQDQAKRTFTASFDKDCGEDDVCKSAIVISPSLRNKAGEELSKAPTQSGFYTIELGSLQSNVLILDVHLNNTGEAAYESTFHVFFPHEAVSYIGLSEDSELNAPLLKNASWLVFNSGNPFKNNENGTYVKLRFQLQNSVQEKVIQFYLNSNTSSVQVVDPSTYVNLVVVTRAEVKIVGGGSPSRVYYGGKRPLDIRGESALSSAAQIGPQVTHKYQVINGGPSPVSVVTVQVDWPVQVENGKPQGKWLLYLTDPPVLKNGKGVCLLPPGTAPNPLNYSLAAAAEGRRRRYKRDLERIVTPSYHDPLKGIRIFTFDCNRGTAKCLNITCQIYDLGNQESVTILIKSRLWNATLEEDYNLDFDPSEEVEVEMFSKARILLDGDVSQNIADDYFSIRTVANRIAFVSVENNLPWWIILIAILAGLLLLVFISLALWKLGFFKRKRIPEEEDDDAGFLISAHFEKSSLQ